MWYMTRLCSLALAVLLIHLAGGEAEGCRCWGGMQGATSNSTIVCG